MTRWNFKTADDVRRIVREAHEAGFNTLFWQVRGNADAFYRSSLEPWGAELTGELGKDPGYDPLELVLEEAHARGMQVHAWFNVFPMWRGNTPPPHTRPRQLYHVHPDWRSVDDQGNPSELNDHYVFASPGNPAVRRHIAAVVRDLARRYDLDGIHLDYIRYGGRQYSHDAVSEQRFQRSGWVSRADWQREQVNETVRLIYRTLKQTRPRAQLSAAVWGVYEDQWGWRASGGFHDYYQDPRAWVRGGYVDFICPMVYWQIRPGGRLDWVTLTEDHIWGCGAGRVVAGIHANYEDFDEIERQIEQARHMGARGVVLFAYPYLRQRDYFAKLAAGPFRAAPATASALPPASP